jgi:hypothetical protein
MPMSLAGGAPPTGGCPAGRSWETAWSESGGAGAGSAVVSDVLPPQPATRRASIPRRANCRKCIGFIECRPFCRLIASGREGRSTFPLVPLARRIVSQIETLSRKALHGDPGSDWTSHAIDSAGSNAVLIGCRGVARRLAPHPARPDVVGSTRSYLSDDAWGDDRLDVFVESLLQLGVVVGLSDERRRSKRLAATAASPWSPGSCLQAPSTRVGSDCSRNRTIGPQALFDRGHGSLSAMENVRMLP